MDEAHLTGRRQAALTFALQQADRVVRLGSLTRDASLARDETRIQFGSLSFFSDVSLGQLAAFRRLAELDLSFHSVSSDDISLLPRSLRRLTLRLHYW